MDYSTFGRVKAVHTSLHAVTQQDCAHTCTSYAWQLQLDYEKDGR